MTCILGSTTSPIHRNTRHVQHAPKHASLVTSKLVPRTKRAQHVHRYHRYVHTSIRTQTLSRAEPHPQAEPPSLQYTEPARTHALRPSAAHPPSQPPHRPPRKPRPPHPPPLPQPSDQAPVTALVTAELVPVASCAQAPQASTERYGVEVYAWRRGKREHRDLARAIFFPRHGIFFVLFFGEDTDGTRTGWESMTVNVKGDGMGWDGMGWVRLRVGLGVCR